MRTIVTPRHVRRRRAIGRVIRKRRRHLGKSQQAGADAIGTDRRTWIRIEQGQTSIPLDRINDLAAYLETTVVELFSDDIVSRTSFVPTPVQEHSLTSAA